MLAFLVPLASIVQASGIGGVFRYSFVSPNLYCLDFGYYDVACAEGITGFDINPAALSRMKTISLATAGSTTKRTDARIDVQIVPDSFYVGQIDLPVALRFEETGGFDFLGEGSKIGPVSFGFGYRRGEEVGVNPTIAAPVTRHWQASISDAISHTFYPQIPPSAGSIPIVLSVAGDGQLNFNIQGSSTVTYTPFTFGMAFDLGPTSFGLGATVNLFRGNANVWGTGQASFTNVTGTVTATSGLTPWTVNITLAGSAKDDSVYQENFKGALDGRQFVLRFGNLTKVTNLIAGELLFGSVVEEVFPATIGTGFTNQITYASGLPLSIIFDTSAVNLKNIKVDSVNHTITGTVDVAFANFSKTTRVDSASYPFRLVPQTNLYFSSVYQLAGWAFNLGGGIAGFLPPGQGLGRMYLDAGIKLHAGIDWHLGVVTALQRYQLAQYSVITPPIVAAGFGVGVKLYGVGIDCALSSNISQAILEAIASSQDIKTVNYTTLNWIGFGFGLKYEF